MTPQLRAAVKEVSQRHRGLRPDWLNDGAKLKRVNVALEPERIFTGRRLIVDSAGDRYVLAMKLVSRVARQPALRRMTCPPHDQPPRYPA